MLFSLSSHQLAECWVCFVCLLNQNLQAFGWLKCLILQIVAAFEVMYIKQIWSEGSQGVLAVSAVYTVHTITLNTKNVHLKCFSFQFAQQHCPLTGQWVAAHMSWYRMTILRGEVFPLFNNLQHALLLPLHYLTVCWGTHSLRQCNTASHTRALY